MPLSRPCSGARGETQRIEVADALGRQLYHQHKLGGQFAMAISSVKYCLKIRNQYAHCNWYADHTGKLACVNLEELAKQNQPVVDLSSLTTHHVDVPLLKAQEAYFLFTDQWLKWVTFEGVHRAGRPATKLRTKPSTVEQPPLWLP